MDRGLLFHLSDLHFGSRSGWNSLEWNAWKYQWGGTQFLRNPKVVNVL